MRKLYVLNHKMNLEKEQIKEYINKLNHLTTKNQIILSPSTLYLDYCKQNTKYELSAQNAYYEDQGAYTGEVSFKQLQSLKIDYCLIGHSERRIIFGETDQIIHNKVLSCLKNNIIPIICVGESKEERELNRHLAKIENQIKTALQDTNIKKLIIAYEPIWSIGTGIIPKEKDLEEMSLNIYNILKDNYNCTFNILYGGSINENNIKQILSIKYIDGVLVGGSSLKIDKLNKIINN